MYRKISCDESVFLIYEKLTCENAGKGVGKNRRHLFRYLISTQNVLSRGKNKSMVLSQPAL